MNASVNRNSADALVLMTPPIALNEPTPDVTAAAATATADRQADHDGRMAEREKQPDRDRPLAGLHQLAGDIVDRRDVVGIDRMPKAEAVGQQRRPEQDRLVVQGDERPQPGKQVSGDQARIDEGSGFDGAAVRQAWPFVRRYQA